MHSWLYTHFSWNSTFATIQEDVFLEGYKRHIVAENAPAPLTYAEEELEMIKKNEASEVLKYIVVLVPPHWDSESGIENVKNIIVVIWLLYPYNSW